MKTKFLNYFFILLYLYPTSTFAQSEKPKEDTNFANKVDVILKELTEYKITDTINKKQASTDEVIRLFTAFDNDTTWVKNYVKNNDKTDEWALTQKGSEKFIVSNMSAKAGPYFFEQILLKPNKANNLHVSIGSINIDNAGYKSEDFVVQIFNRKKTWVTAYEKGEYNFKANVPVEDTDTVAIRISLLSTDNFKKRFFIDYIFADTLALDYGGMKPKDVFEKVLQVTNTGFLNLPAHKTYIDPSIKYPNGLFAKCVAKISGGSICETTQYTGLKFETREKADAMNANWNKQIMEWLKPYKVNSIKKNEKGNKEMNNDEEETIYIKNNAAGYRLFKIVVYKYVRGAGSEFEPMWYETGITIGN